MNKQKIIDVLKEEGALVEGHLWGNHKRCNHPGRCAVGALLAAAGMSKIEVRACDMSLEDDKKPTIKARGLLLRVYGMAKSTITDIMNFNDRAWNSDYTQKNVILESIINSGVKTRHERA